MPLASRLCWVCGNPADSSEHKFKKSDLAHAGKTWAPSDQPYFVSAGGWRRIQGPDSQLVKFGKVLCQACNTTRTQPFDRAYERFAAWVNDKGAALMSDSQIDFAEIYGAGVEDGVLNLLKYFAKHLGCRIASDDYTMPQTLAPSLATADLKPFEVTFARSAEVADFPMRGRGVLHNFPLMGMISPKTSEVQHPYISGMVVGYLDVVYRYDHRPRFSWEGGPVTPSVRTVRLGEYVPGAPHLRTGDIPGPKNVRKILIGEKEFSIPVLSIEHIRHILSLDLPNSEMPVAENLEARLRVSYAILAPFYPDITLSFLEDNLTISDTDALWRCAFPVSE
jgi:hypothetical protein